MLLLLRSISLTLRSGDSNLANSTKSSCSLSRTSSIESTEPHHASLARGFETIVQSAVRKEVFPDWANPKMGIPAVNSLISVAEVARLSRILVILCLLGWTDLKCSCLIDIAKKRTTTEAAANSGMLLEKSEKSG